MCVIALCDNCKVFQIASKRIGYFKLCIFWFLSQFSIGMGLSGNISEWWYIWLYIDDRGFSFCVLPLVFLFLTTMIVTLTQSQRDCQHFLCYLSKP
jgi:hypothetical protein